MMAHQFPSAAGQSVHAARPLLTRFPLFRTGEVDQARAEVGRVFCNHGLNLIRGDQRLECQHNSVSLGRMSLNFLTYGADVDIDPGCLDNFYLAQIPVAGCAQIRSGQEDALSDTQTAVILSPHRQTRMRWFADCAQVLLRIPRELVEQQAGEISGRRTAPVDFQLTVSQAHGPTAFWCRAIVDLACNIETNGSEWLGHRAAVAALEDFLLRGLLSFPRLASAVGERQPIPAAAPPRHLQRAVDYIDANIGEALTIPDIARAACVSVRALEECFRRHYDTTPRDFLRDRRLRHVRDLLLQAARDGAPASVTDVAHRHGFFHLGRFSAHYRQCFGESPSATLKRA